MAGIVSTIPTLLGWKYSNNKVIELNSCFQDFISLQPQRLSPVQGQALQPDWTTLPFSERCLNIPLSPLSVTSPCLSLPEVNTPQFLSFKKKKKIWKPHKSSLQPHDSPPLLSYSLSSIHTQRVLYSPASPSHCPPITPGTMPHLPVSPLPSITSILITSIPRGAALSSMKHACLPHL